MSTPQPEPPAGSEPESTGNAKSAARALAVLQFLASRAKPTPAMTIARACDLPKSSAYHLLNVMRTYDFVVYYPSERAWGLGISAFELGSAYLRSKPLERLGWPLLGELAEGVGETAHLGILHGNETMILVKRQPEKRGPSLVTEVGVRLPAHLTGVGRAMLMQLAPAQFRALYPSGAPLVRRTERGPQLRIELERELAESREKGYATDDSLVTRGITCIAVPVFSHERHPIAALSVTFISVQHARDEWDALAARVRDAATKLSHTLGYHGARDGAVA
jgi:DNA-binding IclR family transcriptional regulator